MYAIVICASAWVFLMVEMWQHTEGDVNILFIIATLSLGIVGPVWGHLANISGPIKPVFAASILGMIGFAMLGPIPAPSVGMGLFGAGVSGEYIITLLYSIKEAGDPIAVSGLSADALGNVIGANLGPKVADSIGFDGSIMVVLVLYTIQLCFLIIFQCKAWIKKKKVEETLVKRFNIEEE